ncbi:MAG: TolC family protein [Rhodothermales bacterium]
MIKKPVCHPRLLALVLLPLMVALSPVLPSVAQDGTLSVDEAISLARTHHPALQALREQMAGASARTRQTFGVSAPRISWFREGLDQDPVTPLSEQRWTVSQQLDFPLASWYRYRRADTERTAMDAAFNVEEQRVTASIKIAYTTLLHAQEMVHLREEEVALSTTLRDAVVTRVEAGEASPLESMKADIQLSDARAKLFDAERAFQEARYGVFRSIGLDEEDQQYTISFPDTLLYVDPGIGQDDVLGRLYSMPELEMADQLADAAAFGVRAKQAAALPSLQFDIYAQDLGGGYDHHGFQIGISLPLFGAPSQKARVQEAEAFERETDWNRTAVILDLKREAEVAWHGYETSRAMVAEYQDVVQSRSRELLARTQEGYALGQIDLVTLLDTQRMVLGSEERFYSALRAYYEHLIRLERFTGYSLVF